MRLYAWLAMTLFEPGVLKSFMSFIVSPTSKWIEDSKPAINGDQFSYFLYFLTQNIVFWWPLWFSPRLFRELRVSCTAPGPTREKKRFFLSLKKQGHFHFPCVSDAVWIIPLYCLERGKKISKISALTWTVVFINN